ncbi:ArsR/SmtB family transcription factor [Streptomyces sp. NPDC056160]|uniref:ArsR/SmtB family transcription factor n=1 Tax=Streptomyces sp. NPDC056160 TaxID=3345731 RepID=UPI0035DDB537
MPRTPAGRTRLVILELLKDPAPPPRRRGPRGRGAEGTGERGTTARAVAVGLGIPLRLAERHLALLTDLGLVRARRVGRRTYYRRAEFRIAEVARLFEKGW